MVQGFLKYYFYQKLTCTEILRTFALHRLSTTMSNIKTMARFDTRLPKEQKEFFEYAAKLGGFRSLTEFIISSVNEKAKAIVKEQETILLSQRDKEVFFDALMNPPSPSQHLLDASKAYEEALNAMK